MRRSRAVAIVLMASLLGFGAPVQAATPSAPPGSTQGSVAAAVVAAKKKPRAQVAATYEKLSTGRVQVVVSSNAKTVQVKYRNAKKKTRTVNRKVRNGSVALALPAGTTKIRAQAKATSRLRASAWRYATPAPAPVTPGPITPAKWRSLAQSTSRTCGIDPQGGVRCWTGTGLMSASLRASATVTASEVPALGGALTGRTVTKIAVGNYHSCAVDFAGLAYCWGSNNHGQLGDGRGGYTAPGSTDPVAVDTGGALAGKTLVDIAVGEQHTCALDSAGLAYCWGWNEGGPLGIGEFGGLSYGDKLTPVPVVTTGALAGRQLTSLALGLYHSCALDSSGALYCWGGDMYGQVGSGKEGGLVGGPNFAEPIKVSDTGALAGKRLARIAAGGHTTCAIDDTSAAYCWGWNGQGQLGRGTSAEFSGTPQPVAFPPGTPPTATITVGFQHTCALTSTAQVLCWGRGDMGSLGTGRPSNEATPTPVDTAADLAGKTITQIAAGGYGTLAVDSEGVGYQTGARSAFAGSAPANALTFRTITNPT